MNDNQMYVYCWAIVASAAVAIAAIIAFVVHINEKLGCSIIGEVQRHRQYCTHIQIKKSE